jgi:hypothetical protein
MAEIELEYHQVTEAEREFWRSLAVVLDHLSKRAINAEAEVLKLRRECNALRERVEFTSLMTAETHAPNSAAPSVITAQAMRPNS